MAVLQLSYYSNTNTSIEDMQNTLDANFIGHHQVTLTEWGTDTVPQIAIGSVVENNGALFKFTANTSISGSPSDGTVYIYLVPSGDPAAGTATVTPTFTNTAPTWSDSKQGWYGTGSYANYRYLEFKITKSSSSYSDKRTIVKNDNIDDININTADIQTATITALSVTENNSYYLDNNLEGTICFSKTTGGTGTFYLKIKKTGSYIFRISSVLSGGGQIAGTISPYYYSAPDKIDMLGDPSFSFDVTQATNRYLKHLSPCYLKIVLTAMGTDTSFRIYFFGTSGQTEDTAANAAEEVF